MNNQHTHMYVRVKPERKRADAVTWFKCAIIGCTHRLKKEFIEGRISICPFCKEKFVILKKHSLLAKPHCDNCTKSDKQSKINEIEKLLENL